MAEQSIKQISKNRKAYHDYFVEESFEAGMLFARTEGILPAPESCHAIAAAVREANKCKESGEQKVILFNLSGHGLIDMPSYDQYLSGDLMNYTLSDEDITRFTERLPQV